MPAIRIPAGIVRGESRAMVSGRWYDGSLIRWHEGNLRPVGGWERISPSPLGSVPRAGYTWTDNDFHRHTAVLCDGKVWRMRDGNWVDITPPDFQDAASTGARGFGSGDFGQKNFGRDGEARGGSSLTVDPPVAFCLDNWGEELLFGHTADGRIWVWKPSDAAAAPIVAPNAPKLVQAFLSTEEHHLMTFGGDGVPNRVAWSDQGNREGWNYANVTGQAGFNDLDAAGKILAAKKIPGAVLIFTQTSVWLCQYIGSPYFYGFTKLAENVAPISPQAVAVAAGKAYWMGKRTFHKFEGGVVQPLPCTLDLDPSEHLDFNLAARRVCSGTNGVYPEIWWFYPSRGQNVPKPENDRYVIFNFVDGWWADGALDRTFFYPDLIEGYPMAGAPDGMVYQHEIGSLAAGASREGLVWAEASNLSFDDGDSNWTVTQTMVDGRPGAGAAAKAVRFDFSGVTVRGGEYRQLGSWTPRPNGYMDTRFTARDFAFRVVGLADVPWSVGALNFTAVQRGKR